LRLGTSNCWSRKWRGSGSRSFTLYGSGQWPARNWSLQRGRRPTPSITTLSSL
jgi:hypothetical protein